MKRDTVGMNYDTVDMKRRHSLYEARHCGYEKKTQSV